MMKWIATMACLFAILGCAGPSVVGKWEYELLGQTIVLDLREDNTFTMGSGGTSAQAGTYTFEDGKVNLNFGSSESPNMTLNMTEDGENLVGSMGAVSVTLKKQGSAS
jgi:hypothetical protein